MSRVINNKGLLIKSASDGLQSYPSRRASCGAIGFTEKLFLLLGLSFGPDEEVVEQSFSRSLEHGSCMELRFGDTSLFGNPRFSAFGPAETHATPVVFACVVRVGLREFAILVRGVGSCMSDHTKKLLVSIIGGLTF